MTSGTRPQLPEHVQRVLNGYANLTADERAQVKARISEIDKGPEDRAVNESVNKGMRITLGPTSTGCPCCGR
jgi:hypothetical protein